MKLNNMLRPGLALAAVALLGIKPAAQADTYGFGAITANNVADANAGQSQLSVDVTDAGGGKVLFQFHNAGPAAMSITDIYFDDGTLLGIASIANGGGVSFSQGASPGNLPAGNTVNFNTTADFLTDSTPPTQPNGVNPGETVGILFNLIGGKTFADTIAALTLSLANPGVDVADGLRIGIHVQGFASGGSESFVNGPPPSNVPDAGTTVVLLGFGIVMLGLVRRKVAA